MRAPAPAYAADLNGATIAAARDALGTALVDTRDAVGEVALFVTRDGLIDAMIALRDTLGLEYQQLMEIAGWISPTAPSGSRWSIACCR